MSRDWQTARLADICEMIARGVAPKYIESGGICVLNQKCVRDHVINIELARRHDINAKRVQEERYVRAGDVLVNSTGYGTLGRVAQARQIPAEPTTVDTHVTIVRPKSGIFVPEFFGYMLISIENEIAEAGEGASGQTELSRNTLATQFKVSFPRSLTEQKRIVAILDEAFAGINAAVANAEKNLANARELFVSSLTSVFAHLGGEYPQYELVDLCHTDRVITYGVIKLGTEVDDGIPCLRTSNVRWLHIDTKGIKRIAPSLSEEFARTVLRGGEVLINVRGTLGGVAVVAPEMAGWNVSREVAVVPVDPSLVLSRYVAYWIGTRSSQTWLSGVKKGVAYVGINIEDLRTLPVPVVPLLEQGNIVAQLEELHGYAKRLEATYRQRLVFLSQLKQSILQKAFAGELTVKEAERAMAAV